MDFKQLRSFVAVVDYRNFSRAAEKLHISQSTVSTHLAQLEEELGVKLLNRTTKTFEVTALGWNVYQHASYILELEGCIREVCSDDGRRILRIGVTLIPATYILPSVAHQYRMLYSNDYLKIKECDHNTLIEGVLDKRFDVGMTEEMVSRDGLTCTMLCRNQPVLVTPATEQYYRLKQQGGTLIELLKEPIILLEGISDTLMDQMEIKQENLKVVARVRDFETAKNLVSSGMGVAVIPEVVARDFVKSNRILAFGLPQVQQERNIYLIYHDGCTSKDRSWNFIDYLLESKDLMKYV